MLTIALYCHRHGLFAVNRRAIIEFVKPGGGLVGVGRLDSSTARRQALDRFAAMGLIEGRGEGVAGQWRYPRDVEPEVIDRFLKAWGRGR